MSAGFSPSAGGEKEERGRGTVARCLVLEDSIARPPGPASKYQHYDDKTNTLREGGGGQMDGNGQVEGWGGAAAVRVSVSRQTDVWVYRQKVHRAEDRGSIYLKEKCLLSVSVSRSSCNAA